MIYCKYIMIHGEFHHISIWYITSHNIQFTSIKCFCYKYTPHMSNTIRGGSSNISHVREGENCLWFWFSYIFNEIIWYFYREKIIVHDNNRHDTNYIAIIRLYTFLWIYQTYFIFMILLKKYWLKFKTLKIENCSLLIIMIGHKTNHLK